jgi:hypothetical protein
VNEIKLNIKLNSKRVRAEDSRPKVELSLLTEKKPATDGPAEFAASPVPVAAAAAK